MVVCPSKQETLKVEKKLEKRPKPFFPPLHKNQLIFNEAADKLKANDGQLFFEKARQKLRLGEIQAAAMTGTFFCSSLQQALARKAD